MGCGDVFSQAVSTLVRRSSSVLVRYSVARGSVNFAERTIAELPKLYINGGARGFLVEISAADLVRVLQPMLVDVAIK